ncbi:MAG TPA: hypothetical protein VLH61_01890 [Bacteroidales bacterium]|nr:hypothetical protein [Bacteroidales bacterium]
MQKVAKKSRLHVILPVIEPVEMTILEATPADCFCKPNSYAPSLENVRIFHEAGYNIVNHSGSFRQAQLPEW